MSPWPNNLYSWFHVLIMLCKLMMNTTYHQYIHLFTGKVNILHSSRMICTWRLSRGREFQICVRNLFVGTIMRILWNKNKLNVWLVCLGKMATNKEENPVHCVIICWNIEWIIIFRSIALIRYSSNAESCQGQWI